MLRIKVLCDDDVGLATRNSVDCQRKIVDDKDGRGGANYMYSGELFADKKRPQTGRKNDGGDDVDL